MRAKATKPGKRAEDRNREVTTTQGKRANERSQTSSPASWWASRTGPSAIRPKAGSENDPKVYPDRNQETQKERKGAVLV